MAQRAQTAAILAYVQLQAHPVLEAHPLLVADLLGAQPGHAVLESGPDLLQVGADLAALKSLPCSLLMLEMRGKHWNLQTQSVLPSAQLQEGHCQIQQRILPRHLQMLTCGTAGAATEHLRSLSPLPLLEAPCQRAAQLLHPVVGFAVADQHRVRRASEAQPPALLLLTSRGFAD